MRPRLPRDLIAFSSVLIACTVAACAESEPDEPEPDPDSVSESPIRIEEEDGREDPAPVSMPAAHFAGDPQVGLDLAPIDDTRSTDRSHLPGTSYCPNPSQIWSQMPI